MDEGEILFFLFWYWYYCYVVEKVIEDIFCIVDDIIFKGFNVFVMLLMYLVIFIGFYFCKWIYWVYFG